MPAMANGNQTRVNHEGIGEAVTHKTACKDSNNPHGHNPNCPRCKRAKFAEWKRNNDMRKIERALDAVRNPLEAELAAELRACQVAPYAEPDGV